MLDLPRWRGAVLIVGVRVVVVNVLPRQHGRTGRAAHGRGHKGVSESCAPFLHDSASFVHHLQRA